MDKYSVYENVLSVSFIYAMGVYRGKNADPQQVIKDSINYYQQTPADPTIGDLMAHWNAKMFIIEFKRTKGHLARETEKETKGNLFLALGKDPRKRELSLRGHFIGYGKYDTVDNKTVADLIFQPYINLMLEERATAEQFNTFIDKLANDKSYGWTKDEMNEYVSFLKTVVPPVVADKSGKSSGGSGVRIKETEGLITIVSPDSQIITLKFRSHLELHWLLTQDITLSQLLSLQQQSQQIKYEIAEKKEQNISRGGPSLS